MLFRSRVERSLRNLSLKLDAGQVQEFLGGLLDTDTLLSSDAVKAALIAKFGPAAAIALEGLKLGTAEAKPTKQPEESDSSTKADDSTKADKRNPLTREDKRQRMRRMTFAFRQPENKDS